MPKAADYENRLTPEQRGQIVGSLGEVELNVVRNYLRDYQAPLLRCKEKPNVFSEIPDQLPSRKNPDRISHLVEIFGGSRIVLALSVY